jgi:hypothetical protein
VVELDTLSIDKRDMISSRVDAFMGRMENKEESALEARRPDAKFGGPLECEYECECECAEPVAGMGAGEWGREWNGVELVLAKGDDDAPASGGGVLDRTEGGGKKERLEMGIL